MALENMHLFFVITGLDEHYFQADSILGGTSEVILQYQISAIGG